MDDRRWRFGCAIAMNLELTNLRQRRRDGLRNLCTPRDMVWSVLIVIWFAAQAVSTQAQRSTAPVPRKGFSLSLWAREPMLRSPVALSFDDHGRLYVVETARRSRVDIDIRGHPVWVVDDLANQSVEDLRGFFRSKMAPEKSIENASWLRDYNGDGSHDWRDLMGLKERIHQLEDVGGSGKADRASIFAEGFNEEISGVVAGVMPWENDVWVTVYPDLWRLRDTNDDGIADIQESVFRGFGVHAAFDGHDLHGLCLGPEGKIYFSIGDNGLSLTNKEGRILSFPNTGGVLRMNPDGSDLEMFATGLRNPQEIAFDQWGNLFAVDNDGDLADERERFVYITEGSDSGWRLHWQFRDSAWTKFTHQPEYNPWIADRMWVPHFPGQPAHLTPPLSNYSVGPGGFKFNPGTALNDSYRDYFFLVQFPVQKITAFQAQPKGAYFEMVHEHLFLSGMMASALNFGPDGAMVVADWDGMWEPSGKGAIWRLDDPKASNAPVRIEVKEVLASGMRSRSLDALALFLGHEDMRIRQRAQMELVRRKARSTLLLVANSPLSARLARVHALWGLGQMKLALEPKELPFNDTDVEIRAQAAKTAGDLRLRGAVSELIRLLSDSSARVQFHAALALGKAGTTNAIDSLVKLLVANADSDPFLRHAVVMGLAGIGSPAAMERLADHPAPAARLGAVLALRRLRAPQAQRFLQDNDAAVRREAVRAIHDDHSIPEALPSLAAMLDAQEFISDEPIVRRVLNANLRIGTEVAAQRLLRFALNPAQSDQWRAEAMECLGSWDRTPSLDRVEGMMRSLATRRYGFANTLISENLTTLLSTTNRALARTVTRLVMENRIAADAAVFAGWVASAQQPPGVRVQALELLAERQAGELESALQISLAAEVPELRLAAIPLSAKHDPDAFFAFVKRSYDQLTLREKQTALRSAALASHVAKGAWLGSQLDSLLRGQLDASLVLDVLEACRADASGTFQGQLAQYSARASATDTLAKFRIALAGGDPGAGRDVFRSSATAQCVRCHEAGGEGFQAGPVLADIASRATPEDILESLVEPSKKIAEGFATISLETRDGEVLDGTKLRDTPDAIVLRLSSGEIRTVPRKEIGRESTSSVSAMPPMGDVLTLFEIRDLIAYLGTLKQK